jgi:hypothetical protein
MLGPETMLKPRLELELKLTTDFTLLYNSIQLLDKILITNRTSLDLAKLYIKAKFEQEKT